MPFEIIRNDITKLGMPVDAIVNPANPSPIVGSGTDHAIHKAAGPELLAARQRIGAIPRGSSAITPAFQLNAKYVIHCVGPRWQGGGHGEAETLRSAYDTALQLALENKCESIAFPLMAAGSYGFPKEKALSIANQAIGDFLLRHEMNVYLIVFNTDAFRLSRQLQKEVQAFVDDYYVERAFEEELAFSRDQGGELRRGELPFHGNRIGIGEEAAPSEALAPEKKRKPPKKSFDSLFEGAPDLDALLRRKAETFPEALIRIIREKGWSDPEVYNRVFMDRRLFNRILNDKDYHTSKKTALLLAFALRLTLDETRELIGKAGYVLSETSKRDIIMAFFITRQRYDYWELADTLFANGIDIGSKGMKSEE